MSVVGSRDDVTWRRPVSGASRFDVGEQVPNHPAYRRVADDLRTQIRAGQLRSQLPSLARLGQQYGVSSDVARQAVGMLRAEGLVETRQGAGAFVRSFPRITRNSPGRLSRARWKGQSPRDNRAPILDHDTGPRLRRVDVVLGE